jgi:hypothetical protein
MIDLIFGVLTPLSAIFQLYHGDTIMTSFLIHYHNKIFILYIAAHGSHGQFLISIKIVITCKKNSFTWTNQNNRKNKNKLSIIIPNKIIAKISIS